MKQLLISRKWGQNGYLSLVDFEDERLTFPSNDTDYKHSNLAMPSLRKSFWLNKGGNNPIFNHRGFASKPL